MRRISTLLAFACVLFSAQFVNAQTCAVGTTNPNPTPGYGATYSMTSGEGFSSTNGTITAFPVNATTTLTSPIFYYSSTTNSVNFRMRLSPNGNKPVDINSYTIAIKYGAGAGTTLSCTGGALSIANGTNLDYFFTISGITLAGNTNFRALLTLNLANSTGTTSALNASAYQINAFPTSAGAALPIHFTGFDAKKVGGGAGLTWKVDVEEGVSGYDIEKSADGRSFTKIGFVAATKQGTYTFSDSKLAAGGAYYRIKSVDVDGFYFFSTVVNLKGDKSLVVLKAFPMPVQSSLTVQHATATAGSEITVSAEDGRVISSIIPASGNTQTTVNTASLKPGLYLLRYKNGNGEVETIKVVKQ